MENYKIILLENKKILINTCESPFTYLNELSADLVHMNYTDTVIIDELLHSGNTEERFINAYFDSEKFENNSYIFKYTQTRYIEKLHFSALN